MFGKLFVKGFKDNLHIFSFGIGVLVLSAAAHLWFLKSLDLHELLAGGLLIVFFPFMALLLGASGFEPELRNDAWAYLFSRPISKVTIWAVKYVASVSALALLWLIFLGMMPTLPGFRALFEGFRYPFVLGTDVSLLPWSVLSSFILLTVAFSLSFFSSKWLNILFAALFIGLAMAFVAFWEAMIVVRLLRDEWIDADKWLHAFRWGLILQTAAFAGGSLLTLARADFSQPRKKIGRFSKFAGVFLVGALVLTAAWTLLLPRTGERYVYLIGQVNDETYFQTANGIFKYSQARNRVSLLTKGWAEAFNSDPIRAGKILYQDIEFSLAKNRPMVLWVINTDGSQKTRLVGGGFKFEDPRSRLSPYIALLSPDGKQVVFFDESAIGQPSGGVSPLWAINSDGTDLRNLPIPRALMEGRGKGFWMSFVAWPAANPASFFIALRVGGSQNPTKIWLYDLGSQTCRIVVDNVQGLWSSPASPREGYLALSYWGMAENRRRLDLLNVKTLKVDEVEIPGARYAARMKWSPNGDKLALIARKGTTPGTGGFVLAVFSVPERKMLASRELTDNEKIALAYSMSWHDDGVRLIASDPTDRSLKILSPDLGEEKRIPFPASLKSAYIGFVSGGVVVVEDYGDDSIWRLDLDKVTWQRIFK